MTAPKGRHKPTGGVAGRPAKEVKRAKTAAAREALSLRGVESEQTQPGCWARPGKRGPHGVQSRISGEGERSQAKEIALAKKEEGMARAAVEREAGGQRQAEHAEAEAPPKGTLSQQHAWISSTLLCRS